ncbi:MAG TPA: hypothetical protein HPP94_10220 [Desulfuromonadales bacterium]|nr:hypothetical protein [Desulfuromonadales bacterium]
MKILLLASVGIIALNITACSKGSNEKQPSATGMMVEKRDGDLLKKKLFHGDLKTSASSVPGTLGIDALKKNHLELSSTKTIGEVFDSYTHAITKEWRETSSENGPHYIDYICWFNISPVSSVAIRDGVVKRGLEIKFVVRGDGETYIAMISRIDIKSDGMRSVSVIDPPEIKKIVTAIYENREITF